MNTPSKKVSLRLISWMSSAGYIALSGAAPAWAADGAATPATPVGEIVVTATKRSESISKVPISIKAYTGADLQKYGIKGIEQISDRTPGVEFDSSTFGPNTLTNIAIRGVDAIFGAPTTGVYIDDIPSLTRVTVVSGFGNLYPSTFDLERVEVLRGPQGTLFGAGAEGGTVRFIPKAPSLTTYSADVNTEVAGTSGGAASYEVGAAVGGPIVADRLGFRLSAWKRRDGGFVDHVDPVSGNTIEKNSNSTDTEAFRLSLMFAPTDWLTITPAIYYLYKHNHDTGVMYPYLSDLGQGRFKNGDIIATPATDKALLYSVKAEADLGFAALTSISSYLHRNAAALLDITPSIGADGIVFTDGSPGYGNPLGAGYPTSDGDLATNLQAVKERDFTQEVRLASKSSSSPVTWLVGAFYSHSKQAETSVVESAFVDTQFGIADGVTLAETDPATVDTQIALFGQATYNVTDRLKITGGLRVARTKYRTATATTGFFYGTKTPIVTVGGDSETPVTPKISASYQLDPNNMFYVTAGKGYRVGGVNTPLPSYCNVTEPGSYKSDTLWSYEIGSKNRLFNNRVNMALSAYHINWSNIQSVIEYPCGSSAVLNAGKAKVNGFDIDLQTHLAPDLLVGFSLAYTDARYTKDLTISGTTFVQSGDAIGSLPQVPSPVNITASAEYEIRPSDAYSVYFHVEGIYHSKNSGPFTSQISTNPFIYDSGLVANPGYGAMNVRIGAHFSHGYELALFINNALNDHPALNVFDSAPGGKFYYQNTTRPRTIGVNGSFQF